MNIAIVTHKMTVRDGQGRVNYEIALEAIRRGHSVFGVTREVDQELLASARFKHIEMPGATIPTHLAKVHALALASSLWLMRRSKDLDVIVGNGFVSWHPSDINLAHFVHGAWLGSERHVARTTSGLYGLYQWIYSWSNARLERLAFATSKRVIAVSPLVAGELETIGVNPDKISVIANGVSPEEFEGDASASEARSELGIPFGVPVALFIGEIRSRRKNLDSVLMALTQKHDWHLAVVGDAGGRPSPYPSMATQLGVEDRTHFLGYLDREHLALAIRAADVFVSLSHYEPFSLVLLEAMAGGLPVATSESVGASQLVTTDAGLVLDDSQDHGKLADFLSAIAADPAGTRAMGQESKRIALSQRWEAVASRYLDFIEGQPASDQ